VPDVPLLRLDDGTDGPLPPPCRMRVGDAAADLPARCAVTIEPGRSRLVPTGFAVAIPAGTCGLILPRSGLALNHGITLLNSPGLIDSGYRGELQVLLYNTSDTSVSIERGQRIAQLLLLAVEELRLIEVAELPPGPDDRGADGFGSSG
jgi:dUTP pyrophosphatase